MQMGQKTYKTCFFALSLSFLYNVGKLEKLSLPLNFPQFPHQLKKL